MPIYREESNIDLHILSELLAYLIFDTITVPALLERSLISQALLVFSISSLSSSVIHPALSQIHTSTLQ